MGFPRQEHRARLPFSSPGDLHDPGIELAALVSPVLQVDSLLAGPLVKTTYSTYI